jgi:DNA-directed RNA polymerase specialized sigma24 family protein
MSVSEEVAANLPCLRRFARAATGSQKSGDAYVVSTLEAILADPAILPGHLRPRTALYRAFLKIVNSIAWNGQANTATASDLAPIDRKLAVLAPQARQAFLLVAVEEFSPREAALVLDIDAGGIERLIEEAGRDIARQIATDVVIIEDEPLIALQLELLVEELGHKVLGIARTHREASAMVESARPGLVLADVHLADGSSGLEAVEEILGSYSVPVVFVTAFPERLLTGTRPEPTFLITKPFRTDNVKATISQALFFDIRGRVEQSQPAVP